MILAEEKGRIYHKHVAMQSRGSVMVLLLHDNSSEY
jgi:hypothetical protein